MEHDEAIRLQATEKYLLNELNPDECLQFEEHFFGCQDCALDLKAAAVLIERSKMILAESPTVSPVQVIDRTPARAGWLAWLRPAFAVPVMAVLLIAVVLQYRANSRLQQAVNSPQLLASEVVNLNVRSGEPASIPTHPGQPLGLSLNVPPDSGYSSYKIDLYSPQGTLEWSRTIPASGNEALSLYIPGSGQEPGTLAVYGLTAAGESVNLGRFRIELQNQK